MDTLFKDILLSEDYVGNMITGELPKRLDNTLFTLIHVLGGFTTSDVINFARHANHREKRLLNKMVNDLHLYDEIPMGRFNKESIINSSRYRALTVFLKAIADTGGADSLMEQRTETDPYFGDYINKDHIDAIFKQWDKLGEADYNVLKFFGVEEEPHADEYTDFRNVTDIVYPLLVIEWLGGVKNTDFAKAPWQQTNDMGFDNLKFKVEPIGFDYLYDESDRFGEHGYACWDIRVLIDKDGDLVTSEPRGDWDKPFVQELFPESARNKLSSHRNYNEDQYELIEELWMMYEDYREDIGVRQFCRVEVILV